MLLKHTLKEIQNLLSLSEIVKAVRAEANSLGLNYKDLSWLPVITHKGLVNYDDIDLGSSRQSFDEYKFSETAHLKDYENSFYALVGFYRNSTIADDVFKKWVAYLVNVRTINARVQQGRGYDQPSSNILDSLPVLEKYFSGERSFNKVREGASLYPRIFAETAGSASAFNNSSLYDSAKNIKDVLSFFMGYGIALQKTRYTYTQVASSDISTDDSFDGSGIDFNSEEFIWQEGEIKSIPTNKDDLIKEIKDKEKYAKEIEQNSIYKSEEMSILEFLNRVFPAVTLSIGCYEQYGEEIERGVTYKFVFDIKGNKMIYVDSIQLYQALYTLYATGTEKVNIYYDAEGDSLVLRGKDYSYTKTITVSKSTGDDDDRFSVQDEVKEKTYTVPTFSIIEAQPVSEMTDTIGIEYVEFYEEGYTFKDKYEILNPSKRSPLELNEDFESAYPSIAATYQSQISVGNSNKSLSEKFEYAESIIDSYIDSYTLMAADKDGKLNRVAKPRKSWKIDGYVYRVEESYWKYNNHINSNELLAYFIAKGNRKGYRLLSLKILGIDYWLFYDAIINSLLQEQVLFVTRLSIDEENYKVEVNYLDESSYVSGDIYSRKRLISDEEFEKNLASFFGSDLGASLHGSATEVITSAINNRFIPTIKVKTTDNPAEDEALRLNIDLHCPIFYNHTFKQGQSDITFSQASSTGSNHSNFLIECKTVAHPKRHSSGLIQSFYEWISGAAIKTQILGGFEPKEILDGYILPISGKQYMYHYILPRFENVSGTRVGIGGLTSQNYSQSHLKGVDDETKEIFFQKGLIASVLEVTPDEYKEIHKQFLIQMKERLWDVKREGRRLFNMFLQEEVESSSLKLIQNAWNETYNNYAKPALNKQPIFITHNILFGSKASPTQFSLREAQIEGIRHVSSRDNSGLLLHEVGFGKTTTSIAKINEMFETGEAKRALFLVPNSVYDKFGEEILGTSVAHGLFPNANVVWLGNAKTKAIMELKNFTEEELQALDKYDDFRDRYPSVEASLSRQRITLAQDPKYIKTSSYSTFYDRLIKELKSHIPKADKVPAMMDRIEEIGEAYAEVNVKAERAKEKYDDIINSFDSSDELKEVAKTTFISEIERLSNVLSVNIYEKILVIGNTLIDEIGEYKDYVRQDKTIFIGTHNAVQTLRPSASAVHRALSFKLGKKSPNIKDLITDARTSSWSDGFGTKSKFGAAQKIVSSNPISLAKLNIDAVVVDEIHNFNNIVGRVNSKGIRVKRDREHPHSIGSHDFTPIHQKTFRGHFSSTPTLIDRDKAGNSKDYSDIRMASTWTAADKNKLNLAALCFDIQYKNPKSKNVILLSATPFTDHPLQVLSVLGMANYELLSNNGIHSSFDFFNNYVEEVYKNGIRHDETFGLFVEIDKYYNDKALSNLITNIANVKITDAEIEKARPVKAVIPQNKENSKTDTEQTYNMGTHFDVLEDVSSKIALSDAQKKMKAVITEYLEDDDATSSIYDLFPIMGSVKKESEAATTDEKELDDILRAKRKEIKEDPESAEDVRFELSLMLTQDEYRDHPKIVKLIDTISTKYLGEEVEKEDDSDDTAGTAVNLNTLNKKKRQGAKAISCQATQEALVISPYLVTVGYKGMYKCKWLPDLEDDPAKVFVENSPKLLFTVKAIQETLNYQKEQLKKGEIQKIGGQVVYFNKFNFTYGGKKYNAFDLLTEYIVRFVDGISDEKFAKTNEYTDVGVIAGAIKDDNTTKKVGKGKNRTEEIVKRGKTLLRDQFNDGTVKILLGSKSIKEGIDLQGNAHTMYLCQAEFSPTVSMQLEGRIWRQKNPYDNVRIVYVLAINSIDSFIYDKLNKKINNIKRMLESGVYEMNTTQFTIDTRERLLELITDVDKLTELELSEQKKIIQGKINDAQMIINLLDLVERKYETLINKVEGYLPTMDIIYNGYSEIYKENQLNDIRKELNRARKPQINKVKSELEDEFKKLKDKSKYISKEKQEPSFELYLKDKDKDLYKAWVKADRRRYDLSKADTDKYWDIEENWDNLERDVKRDESLKKRMSTPDSYIEWADDKKDSIWIDRKKTIKHTIKEVAEHAKKSQKELDTYTPKNKPEFDLYVKENQDKIDAVSVKDDEIMEAFEESDWVNPIPKLSETLNTETPYSVLEQVNQWVQRALKEVHRVGGNISFLSEEEQSKELNKKTIGAKLSNLFLTTPLAKDVMYDSPDGKVFTHVNVQGGVSQFVAKLATRMSILIKGSDSEVGYAMSFKEEGENPEENPIILSAYQEYVKANGKTVEEIPELKTYLMSTKKDEHGKTIDEYRVLDENPDEFRKEIRERWEEIIANRMEKEDFDVDSVVKSFTKSNVLIKLR
jgi:hypothetical protein